MSAETKQYFDEKAFSTLLNSDDASLLYPLFERALDSLTRFIKEPIKDYSLLEFETHTKNNLQTARRETLSQRPFCARESRSTRRRRSVRCIEAFGKFRIRTGRGRAKKSRRKTKTAGLT